MQLDTNITTDSRTRKSNDPLLRFKIIKITNKYTTHIALSRRIKFPQTLYFFAVYTLFT